MSNAGTLLAFKMFHKIAFELLANSMNRVLKQSRSRSLQYDNNEILEAEDVLKRCIAHFPFFMVKNIFCRESTKEPPVKCIIDIPSKAIVSPYEINIHGRTFNWDDLEKMMTRLLYIAVQFYDFGGTRKNESYQTLTYETDFLTLTPKKVFQVEFSAPKPDSGKCPPTFGCAIKLDCLGNLLGQEPCREIKYDHSSYPSYKQCEVDEYKSTEHCSQLKPIGYEVKTKRTAANMPIDKLLVTDKADYQVGIEKIIDKELSYLKDRNCHIQVSCDSEIVPDDGAHPLLDCPEPDEGIKISKGLEDFLARVFSEKATSVITDEKQTICNPPCSVWCDSVKAKCFDTCPISNEQTSDLRSNYGIFKRNLDLIKPVYAKNSSANDPQYLGYNDIQFASENTKNSQKAMQELPKNLQSPVDLKVQNNKRVTQNLTSKNSQGNHYKIFDQGAFRQNTYLHQRTRRSTWSFVEDASSLWQYLPDCIPDDHIFRQPSQRGTRDLRRQNSFT